MRAAILFVVAAGVFGGCHCSSEGTGGTASTGSGEGSSESSGTKPKHNRKPADPGSMMAKPDNRPKIQSQPLDEKELTSWMPEGVGEVLLPFAIAPGGKQAHVTWCLKASDPKVAADTLVKAFSDKGWTKVGARGSGATIGVSGEHGGYHLAVVVRGNDSTTCPQAQGKYPANITIFRLGLPAPQPNMLPPPTPAP